MCLFFNERIYLYVVANKFVVKIKPELIELIRTCHFCVKPDGTTLAFTKLYTGCFVDDKERDEKTLEEIAYNKGQIKIQYQQVFGKKHLKIVDNYDWFSGIGYLEFLRSVGKRMSMSQLLDREFVKNRVGEGGAGLSYAEFSYSLIQGYDFLHLFEAKNATLQICGADQWGNSLTGVELIRKKRCKKCPEKN